MMNDIDRSGKGPLCIAVVVAALVGVAIHWLGRQSMPQPVTIPYFAVPVGKVRPPLPYRIVSFHKGRADKNLIKLASQLGFNGVQIQIEGSNENGIKAFASREKTEHLIDYCHALGMQVTVWVHEISDLPDEFSTDYLGPVTVDNEAIWDRLEKRYEWMLSEAIPNVDGLVLTTVETQVNATSTPIMQKLVELIDRKCHEHGKSLIVRTFVWHPDELDSVMAAVKGMPNDIVMMSKVVSQDWQMRGGNSAEIGAVGGRPQIVEYDVAGEYFLKNNVANCMVDLLHRQFDYGISKGVQGICVRVDRDDSSVLFEPQEVNLWALGLLASGASDNDDDIWRRWATYRYGPQAVPGVVAALRPTGEVVAEMLSIGSFTLGDTRRSVPLPDEDIFNLNWQNWRWYPAKYASELERAQRGEASYAEEIQQQKAATMIVADQSITDLERARNTLSEKDYRILHTRLVSNKVQLEFRSLVAMAALHSRRITAAANDADRKAAMELFLNDYLQADKLQAELKTYPAPRRFNYLGKTWTVDYPLGISPEVIATWMNESQ